MKSKILVSFLLIIMITGCKNNSASDTLNENEPNEFYNSDNENETPIDGENNNLDDSNPEEKYPDDTYCAEVEYYNPNTRNLSHYTLTVEVENNEVTEINFPQGWLDGDDFSSEELDENGEAEMTTYRGYQYTIKIIGSSNGCYEDVPRAEQCLGMTDEGDQCEKLTDNQNGYCWQHEDQE